MIKIGIVGGTGYTGVELLRILGQHPQAEITCITSRKEAGLKVSDLYPSLRNRVDIAFQTPDEAPLSQCDVVFFATPHGVAMVQARELLDAGVKVIDLAADFRLQDPATFEAWYGMPHSCTDLLSEAVYALPEFDRERIKGARLIGLPGCYPTAVQLGLMPLLEQAHLIDTSSIIADCKSGISGAGRKAEVGSLYAESGDSFKAYAAGGHRHWPEIHQGLENMLRRSGHEQAAEQLQMAFVPHLLPIIRGIHATVYVRLTDAGMQADLQTLYETRYADEPFVDVLPKGSHPETRSVRASNFMRIALHRPPVAPAGSGEKPKPGNLLTLLVVEDNLVKGASGQAVQVMNLLFDLPETMGLELVPVMP